MENVLLPCYYFLLIENAFKHGVLTEEGKPVNIDLKITDQHMKFSITNFNNTYQKDDVGGIGLQNVKKRLDLIYGEKYKLGYQQNVTTGLM